MNTDRRHQGQRRPDPPAQTAQEAVSRFRQAFGSADELVALAQRIKYLASQQGETIDDAAAQAAAQRVLVTGENIFRGDVRIYVDRDTGQLVMMPPYDRMVALAKELGGYVQQFKAVPEGELREGDLGFDCYVIRYDAMPLLQMLLQNGVDYQEAYASVASVGRGIVHREEMVTEDGKERKTVTNWSWAHTARKRALTAALRLSHGMPPQALLTADSWMVGDTVTDYTDWLEADAAAPGQPDAMAETARLSAQTRERLAHLEALDPEERNAFLNAELARNNALLHGDPDEPEL